MRPALLLLLATLSPRAAHAGQYLYSIQLTAPDNSPIAFHFASPTLLTQTTTLPASTIIFTTNTFTLCRIASVTLAAPSSQQPSILLHLQGCPFASAAAPFVEPIDAPGFYSNLAANPVRLTISDETYSDPNPSPRAFALLASAVLTAGALLRRLLL